MPPRPRSMVAPVDQHSAHRLRRRPSPRSTGARIPAVPLHGSDRPKRLPRWQNRHRGFHRPPCRRTGGPRTTVRMRPLRHVPPGRLRDGAHRPPPRGRCCAAVPIAVTHRRGGDRHVRRAEPRPRTPWLRTVGLHRRRSGQRRSRQCLVPGAACIPAAAVPAAVSTPMSTPSRPGRRISRVPRSAVPPAVAVGVPALPVITSGARSTARARSPARASGRPVAKRRIGSAWRYGETPEGTTSPVPTMAHGRPPIDGGSRLSRTAPIRDGDSRTARSGRSEGRRNSPRPGPRRRRGSGRRSGWHGGSGSRSRRHSGAW